MIPLLLRHSGSRAFPDPIEIDFRGLSGVVAVVGPVGAGKTTLLDMVAALAFGQTPYRQRPLWRQFSTRGVIEGYWEHGGIAYRTEIRVDPEKEETEARLHRLVGSDLPSHFNPKTAHMLGGPLATDFRKSVERVVGGLDVFLASAYGVQGGAGNLARQRTDRKPILAALLDLESWEKKAEAARKRSAAAAEELAAAAAQTKRLEVAVARRGTAEGALREAEEALAAALPGLSSLRERHSSAAAERITLGVRAASTADLRKLLSDVRSDRLGIESRVTALSVDSAVTVEARTALAAARREVEAGEKRLRELTEKVEADRLSLFGAGETGVAAAREEDSRLELELAGVNAAVAAAADAREAVSEHQRKVTDLARQVSEATEAGKLLLRVPCRGEGEYAGCQFLRNATTAVSGLGDKRDELGRLKTQAPAPAPSTADLMADVRRITARRGELRKVIAREPDVIAARARVDAAASEQVAVTASLSDLAAREPGLVSALDASVAEQSGVQERETARLRDLDEALSEREEALTVTLAGAEAAERVLAEAAATEASLGRMVAAAEAAVSTLEREVGRKAEALEAVAADEASLVLARERETAAALDASDLALCARACGRSGVQALLVDQALPEIGQSATALLAVCLQESPFTVQMSTQRESADGDKMLERLDVYVERDGRRVDVEDLSGGERVLVSESLALGVSSYVAARRGPQGVLMRDETESGLGVLAGDYVRMLRRAAAITGAGLVLFVTHNQDCVATADSVIRVSDGKIWVE